MGVVIDRAECVDPDAAARRELDCDDLAKRDDVGFVRGMIWHSGSRAGRHGGV